MTDTVSSKNEYLDAKLKIAVRLLWLVQRGMPAKTEMGLEPTESWIDLEVCWLRAVLESETPKKSPEAWQVMKLLGIQQMVRTSSRAVEAAMKAGG